MDIGWIALSGPSPDPALHGEKAALLAAAHDAGLTVPPGFALPAGHQSGTAGDGNDNDDAVGAALARLEEATGLRLGCPDRPLLLAVRPAAEVPAGGVAPAILNIGVTSATLPALAARHGERTARDLHRRLIHAYGAAALGLEGEEFEYALHDALRDAGCESETDLTAHQLAELAETCLKLIDDAGMDAFPDDARAQLDGALAALPRLWSGRRAAARRAAIGAADAPLGTIVQAMVLGIGHAPSGAGLAQLRDEATGEPCLAGRYLAQAQGDDALMGLRTPQVLTTDERHMLGLHEPALEETAPGAVPALQQAGRLLEAAIGDAVALEFTVAEGRVHILEVKRAKRSARAAVRIAVDLAEAGAIDRETALMRVDPAHLEEQLHPAIDPDAPRDLLGQGLPASPGRRVGPAGLLARCRRGGGAGERPSGATILALIETSPEDIRGMHAAKGVLTVRGGMTSHAAVVARGLGKPCVVGARGFVLDRREGTLRAADGRPCARATW